jgi:hypothetical protein
MQVGEGLMVDTQFACPMDTAYAILHTKLHALQEAKGELNIQDWTVAGTAKN